MLTILPLIKGSKRIMQIVCLMLTCILINNAAHAQTLTPQVNITVNILPPYSPYYSDYAGANAANVLLTVRNLTSTQKRIKLTGQLTGDNGIKVSTKSTYTPLQPIILLPNETKQLNGLALKDIFDLNSLNVYGVDKVKLVQTSRLPEGNYSFCIQAVDMNTNQVITDQAPLGCTQINITYPNAPILISPRPFEIKDETTINNITFNWMNPGTVPMNTQYIIQIAQMPNTQADPNQVLNATTQPILNQRIIGLSYVYGPGNVPLKVGSKYAWRVIATDPSNKTGFMNDGKSQANVFIYGNDLYQLNATQLVDIPIVLVEPKNFGKEVVVNNKTPLYLRWKFINTNPYQTGNQIDYGFVNNINKINDNSLKYTIQIYDKQSGAFVDDARGFDLPFYQEKREGNKLKFVDKRTYEFVITAHTKEKSVTQAVLNSADENMQLNLYNVLVGKSVKGSFIYRTGVDVIDPLPTLTLKGKVQYAFDNDPALYPVTGQMRLTKYFKQVDANGKIIKNYVSASSVSPDEPSQYLVNLNSDGTFAAVIKQTPAIKAQNYLTFFSIDYPTNNYYLKPIQEIELKSSDIVTTPFVENPNKPLLSVNLGEIIAKVKAYKLNINFSKGYTAIFNGNTGTQYKTKVIEALSGLQVTIYRENKNVGIPVYEGGAKTTAKTLIRTLNGNKYVVVVAKDTTRVTTEPGKVAESSVSFNQLLATVNDTEPYWINVMDPKTNSIIYESAFRFKMKVGVSIPGKKNASEDIDFTSQKKLSDNYSEVEKDVVWTVTQAPVATVKGRLLYQYADGVGGARPLANKSISLQPFLVFTEKKAGGKSYVLPANFNNNYISKEGSNTNVNDSYDKDSFIAYKNSSSVVNATVTTNADGSFEFKDIALWDSVAIASSAYSFYIPGKKMPPPPVSTGAAIDALKNGDKDTFIGIVKDSFTDYLRDPFNPNELQGYLETAASPIPTTSPTAIRNYGSAITQGFQSGSYLAPVLNLNLKINTYGYNNKSQPKSFVPTFTEFVPKQGPNFNFNDVSNINTEEDYITPPVGSNGLCNVRLIYRVVVNEKEVFCSPDEDILINPLQTLDVGTLYSVVKTAKIRANLFDANGYDSKTGIGSTPITNVPIELKRTEIVYGLQGEGETYNNVLFKEKPSADAYMVDYGSSVASGLIFNHVLLNKSYSLEAIIKTEANNSTSFKTNKVKFDNNALDVNEAISLGKDYIFNSEFVELTVPWSLALQADDPVIAGRLINRISQKGIRTGASVIIKASGLSSWGFLQLPVDKDGYFSYKSDKLKGKTVTVEANITGYTTDSVGITGSGFKYQLNNMQVGQKNFKNLYFKPSSIIAGFVVNEKDEDLPSIYGIANEDYVQQTNTLCKLTGQLAQLVLGGVINEYQYLASTGFNDSPISDCKQVFNVYVTPNVESRIHIIPNDLKYFDEVIPYTAKTGTNSMGKVVLKTREHRIIFKVVGPNNEPVPFTQIKFLDKVLATDGNGQVVYSFMNISETNFYAKATPLIESGYQAAEIAFTNLETRDFVIQPIMLYKGQTIGGKVTLNGEILANAKVYVNNGNGAAITETTSGSDGRYALNGVKKAGRIVVTVVGPKHAGGTIIGAGKEFIAGSGDVNFDLKLVKNVDLTKLLGYNIGVENLVDKGNNQYLINGTLDLSNATSDFKIFDEKMRVGFNDILVKVNMASPNLLKPIETVADQLPLDLVSIRARFDAAYNVTLKPITNAFVIKKISATSGSFTGKVNIVDNSFKFPSSYLTFSGDNFYFALNQNNTITNTIPLFSTVANVTKSNYYFTNNKGGDIGFKLLNFEAVSPAGQTYYSAGKIRLLPTITATGVNTLGKNLSVNLPQLLIDQNGVTPIESDKPLEFNLEKWIVRIPKWKLSTEEGGIVATSKANIIKTGVLDIPFETFRLRNEILLISDAKLNSIKVGGIVDVNLSPSTVSTFGLDQKTGNDLKQHYILRMLGQNGSSAGNISNLDGMPENIEILAATLVSSGEQYIDFSPNSKTIKAYGIVDFQPSMIESSNNSFSILGNVDLKIPRLPAFNGGFLYQKNNLGKVVGQPKFETVKFDIGKGYVQFNSPVEKESDQGIVFNNEKIITNGILTIKGTVFEPGNKLPKMPVILTKTAFVTKIESPLNERYTLNFDESKAGTKMQVYNAKTEVKDNDWDYLTFVGELKQSNGQPMDGFKSANPLTFKVYGEVGYDEGKIEVKESTAFGTMTMVFDWPNKEIIGNITLDKFTVGDAASVTGEAEMMIGKNGFYTFFAGDVNYSGVPVIFPLKASFLVGVCSKLKPDVLPRVMQFSHNKLPYACGDVPFAGFLLAGRKDVFEAINFNLDLPPIAPLVSVGLVAECGVDAAMFLNFADKSILLQAGAFGNVRISLAAITGTSASGNVNVDLNTRTQYQIGSFPSVSFCTGVGLGFNVKQTFLGETIFDVGGNIDLSVRATISNHPKFEISKNSCTSVDDNCTTKK